MAGVIKAGTLRERGWTKTIAFDFRDVTQSADAYLDQVREQARELATKIVSEAKADAEKASAEAKRIRQQAEQQGFAAGQQAAEKNAMQLAEKNFQAKLTKELAALVPVLTQTVAACEQAKVGLLRQWHENLIGLATAIAERVVRRELSRRPEITVDWIREAVELASGSERLKLHLNPADCETLRDRLRVLTEQVSRLAPTDVVADTTVSPGGCKVVTEFGEVDQQVEEQIRRIREELL